MPRAVALREQELIIPENVNGYPGATVVVAELGNEIVGTGQVSKRDDEEFAQIRRVAVTSEYQGRKIGEQVVRTLEDIAFSLGANSVELETYNAWHFYRKLGYYPTGMVETAHGDRHHMQRFLDTGQQ